MQRQVEWTETAQYYFFYNFISVHWGLRAFVYTQLYQSPAKAVLIRFRSGLGLGHWKHIYSVVDLLQCFRITNLLHDPVLQTHFPLRWIKCSDSDFNQTLAADRRTHIWLQKSSWWLTDCKVLRFCVCKTSPNHYTSTTMLTAGMRCLAS